MEKLGLIFLELRFACFLNNRGNPRSPVLLHTLTHYTHHSFPPSPLLGACPFLAVPLSFFFSSERGIVWQLFLLVDWNRERENSVTRSVSNFQRKLPPLPQTLYTYSGKHTLPSGLDHSSNRATVKAAFNAVLFFSFSLIQNLEGRKIKICSLLSARTEQLLSRVTGEFNIHIIETPVNHEHYFF